MSKPPATWRSGWTRFLLCETQRCLVARAEERGVRQWLNPKGIPIIQPKVGRASGLPWVNVQIIHNPEAGCIYFSERGCVQAHQPQHSCGPNTSQTENRCGWSCRHSRAPTKGPDTTMTVGTRICPRTVCTALSCGRTGSVIHSSHETGRMWFSPSISTIVS